jgi:hypothetical protein
MMEPAQEVPMYRALLSVLVVLILAAVQAPAAEPKADVDLLLSWLTGSFSSAAQAAADPEFRDIRLHTARIWPERTDAAWLYVEQAVADQLDQPYRQRVYRVTRVADNLFESQVLELPDPLRFVGAWRAERPLEQLTPTDLTAREGCAIFMRRKGDAFMGSTLGRLCTSEHRGASWATSEVTVSADGLLSWDRGFDAGGVQVWGAVKGGYAFRRLTGPEPLPAPTAPPRQPPTR